MSDPRHDRDHRDAGGGGAPHRAAERPRESMPASRGAMVPAAARVVPQRPNMTPGAGGGLSFLPQNWGDVRDLCEILASAGPGVPKPFQGNPGACLSVVMDALAWGMIPTQVIRKAYVVNGIVAYEAQLIHAVINARAGLMDDLDVSYAGEGPDLRVTVKGKLDRGNRRELSYESPKFKDIKVKNSPLWSADPRQQFHYYGVRAWARRWCPEVILGVYTREEAAEISDADREAAIEHRTDILQDDYLRDPDEPVPSAPLHHRLSWALEQITNDDQRKAAQLRFETEIGALSEADRWPLRKLVNVHIRRLTGELKADDVMAFSRGIRDRAADELTEYVKAFLGEAAE